MNPDRPESYRSLKLPPAFRKLAASDRLRWLRERLELDEMDLDDDLEKADRLVENAFGWQRIPLGLVTDLPVNGVYYQVPLATEEPSVIAAATHAARILSRAGGLAASAQDSVIRGQIFLKGADTRRWDEAKPVLQTLAEELLVSMKRRGGGLRSIASQVLPDSGLVLITLAADVRDAQGANAMNTVLEALAPKAEELLGGRRLMAILSNNSPERLARASFTLPMGLLARSGRSGEEMGRRIELAWKAACESPDRAVTHNKGIMNGITALALATGNDTRALEAAVHAFAARSGKYQPLSRYRLEDGALLGEIELPLPLATVGGGTGVLPTSPLVWKILGVTSARELMEVAAGLGLAQNLAALMALCAEGIQAGHMRLHSRRLAPEGGQT